MIKPKNRAIALAMFLLIATSACVTTAVNTVAHADGCDQIAKDTMLLPQGYQRSTSSEVTKVEWTPTKTQSCDNSLSSCIYCSVTPVPLQKRVTTYSGIACAPVGQVHDTGWKPAGMVNTVAITFDITCI